MITRAVRSTTAAIACAALVLLSATACASDTDDEQRRGPRLADAKSIVQLVRNEAGERVPAASVASVTVVKDGSEACVGADDDPAGAQRRWVATSVITFTDGASSTLESAYADLINSFSANGWSEVSYGGGGSVTLQKPESDESIAFLATPADDDSAAPASITMSIASGCVDTAGEGSAEVAVLEDAAT